MKPEEVIAFLLYGQLLDVRDFVKGEIRVEDRSARHRSFAVHCTSRVGYFIKRASSGDVLGSLDSEAAFYRLANSDGRLAALKPYLPAFYRYDSAQQLLTLELVSGADTARGMGP